MIRLSKKKDTEIRNRLDDIANLLHHDIARFEDLCWAHMSIKDLLFIIDELQGELKYSGETP